jgi:hypothetical protein
MRNSIKCSRVAAGVALAVLLSASAVAGDAKSQKTVAAFQAMDKNADQQISRTEAAADKSLADNFASLDSNGDGYVSESEYMAKAPSQAEGT